MSPTRYSPVRHSRKGASSFLAVRLACLRRAASVRSEPGSNSPWLFSSTRRYMISSFKFNSNYSISVWIDFVLFPYLWKLLGTQFNLQILLNLLTFQSVLSFPFVSNNSFWFAPSFCLTVIKNIPRVEKSVNTFFYFFYFFFIFFYSFSTFLFIHFYSNSLLLFFVSFKIIRCNHYSDSL